MWFVGSVFLVNPLRWGHPPVPAPPQGHRRGGDRDWPAPSTLGAGLLSSEHWGSPSWAGMPHTWSPQLPPASGLPAPTPGPAAGICPPAGAVHLPAYLTATLSGGPPPVASGSRGCLLPDALCVLSVDACRCRLHTVPVSPGFSDEASSGCTGGAVGRAWRCVHRPSPHSRAWRRSLVRTLTGWQGALSRDGTVALLHLSPQAVPWMPTHSPTHSHTPWS